jgi:hypothetical protein
MKELTDESPLDEWMMAAYDIAQEHYDGCITVISSHEGNKFSFSTVTDAEHIEELDTYAELKHAIINAIEEHFSRERILRDELKSILS